MQHVRLKRFAKSCLATVRRKFPDPKKNARLDDPERIGAIFPLKEWDCESPLKDYFPIQVSAQLSNSLTIRSLVLFTSRSTGKCDSRV